MVENSYSIGSLTSKKSLKAKVLENYNGGYSACVGYITADILPSVEKKAENKK